ncbi:MAG: hypothetical protein KAS72_04565 [Phycisphaerales bacterium]|nr:hypothetical protein [Phycisphaerales bacterium]
MAGHARQRRNGSAFTLIELIVAGIIAALLTGATTYTVSRAVEARTISRGRQQAHGRADAALARITREASAILRNREPSAVLVRVRDGDATDDMGRSWSDDELLLFARNLHPVRPDSDQAEGGDYESQFRIEREAGRPAVLWHRRDPVIDEIYDGGGVASPIAEHVVGLEFSVFDGAGWQDSWDSDNLGVPLGLRITVIATSDDGRAIVQRRGIVSFDRTPLPYKMSDALESLGVMDAQEGGR